MDITLLMLLSAAFFISAFIKGLTGLGFSTTCLGILALSLDIKTAIPLVIIPSVTSNIVTMYRAGHFRETVVRFWPMLICTVPGLLIGIWLLTKLDTQISGAALGIILIAYAIFALLNPAFTLSASVQRPIALPVGFITGLINGTTGSQVMPVLPYLLSLKLDNDRFVQAINCSFTLSSLILAATLINIGYMTSSHILSSSMGLIFVFIGVQAGTAIRQNLSTELFRKIILIFLIILGIGLLMRLS